MKHFFLLILLAFAIPVFSQSLNNGLKVIVYKHYDTTKAENYKKIKRRRLTTNIEENGFSVYGFDSTSFFKLNFINGLGISINKRSFFTKNGIEGYELGSNNYSFKMYINANHEFEFDAVLKRKPPFGIHSITFGIEHKGLKFLYQDSALVMNKTTWSPPEIWNSYAIYKTGNRANYTYIDGADTTYELNGIGKFGHIKRPIAYDKDFDSIYANIKIDTILNTLTLFLDSFWLTNANFPVVIDPVLGKDTIGASWSSKGDYQHVMLYGSDWVHQPGAMEIDSARVAAVLFASIETGNWVITHTWEWGATVAATYLHATSDSVEIIATSTKDPKWYKMNMSGSFSASTDYCVSSQMTYNTQYNPRYCSDTEGWGDAKTLADNDFVAPADYTGGASHAGIISVAVFYSAGGAPSSTPNKRRKIILNQ